MEEYYYSSPALALALGLGFLSAILLGWWKDIRHVLPLKWRSCLAVGPTAAAAKLPPGHMGFPIFGEMLTFLWYFKFLGRPDEFIIAKRNKYGEGLGMYRTHLFGSPSIIACSPSIIKFVFQSGDKFILDWPSPILVGTRSVVAVNGESHSRLRRFVTTAINQPEALRRIALLVQPKMVAALHLWSLKGKVIAHHEIRKVTFENVGKLFANLEPGSELNTMNELFQGLLEGLRGSPFNIPGFAFHHALKCRKKLETIFREKLEKKKMMKKKQNGDEKVIIGNDEDLMDGLMEIEDEEGNKLSDQEVIDNIVTLVVAGYESTSIASTWAIFFLAKYPNVLSKVREENLGVNQNNTKEFITSEDVSQLHYTNKLVEETIRMANVAPFTFRTATKEVEYKGYKIPKGWKVIIWNRYLHTNPDNFEDPMCFNPDRWNKPPKPGTHLVFGGGSRICAGNMLARIQMALLIHHLSTKYKWELLNPEAEIKYLPHPKPVDGVEIAFSKL